MERGDARKGEDLASPDGDYIRMKGCKAPQQAVPARIMRVQNLRAQLLQQGPRLVHRQEVAPSRHHRPPAPPAEVMDGHAGHFLALGV